LLRRRKPGVRSYFFPEEKREEAFLNSIKQSSHLRKKEGILLSRIPADEGGRGKRGMISTYYKI